MISFQVLVVDVQHVSEGASVNMGHAVNLYFEPGAQPPEPEGGPGADMAAPAAPGGPPQAKHGR